MAAEEAFKFYLANQMQSVASSLLNTLLDERFPQNRTFGELCRNQLVKVSSSALRNEHWALSVFDSLGKPRPGLMQGSLFNLVGDYDQCQAQAHFKHCQAQVKLEGRQLEQVMQLVARPKSFFEPIVGAPRLFKLDLCVPRVCKPDELGALARYMLSADIEPAFMVCASSTSSVSSWASWFSLLALVALIALVTAASFLDGDGDGYNDPADHVKSKQRQKQTCPRNGRLSGFIEAFSAVQTTRRLLVEPTWLGKKPALDLRPLDGLRAVSTLWIIAIHSYSFAFQWLLFDNLDGVDNVYKSLWSQWLGNGSLALDNFLLISGLLAYLRSPGRVGPGISQKSTFEGANNNKIWKMLARLMGRYLRLAPTLMLLILFSLGLLPHMSRGPQWAQGTRMFDEWCQPPASWFLNLILAHNLIGTKQMCFSHSWYAGVDFQLFALLHLLLWLRRSFLNKNPNGFKWLLVALICAAQLLGAYLVYINNLTYLPLIPSESLETMLFFQGMLYIKPHHWLASYFLGVLLGICLSEPRRGRRPAQFQKRAGWVQFLVSTAVMLALIWITLPYFRGSLRMSGAQSALAALLVRPLWSLSLASLLFVILHRQNGGHQRARGSVNGNSLARRRLPPLIWRLSHNMLSSSLWRPLSRISYPAYLLHPPLMAAFYSSQTQTFQFSHQLLLYFTLGHTILTYVAALALHLLLEAPASHLATWRLRLAPNLSFSSQSPPPPPPSELQQPMKSASSR